MAIATDTLVAASRAEVSGRTLAVWLLICAAMVFAMALIGAITRLTESGLSITEWQPLIGAIPPLSDAEWARVFGLYQATPEYRLENAGMTLEAFKQIFFWEWLHRLWGRLIGLVFALPLAWWWLRGRLPARLKPRLLGLLALGAAQGALGWFMVASGLVDRPSVSHWRLAAHLGVAIALYAALLWLALDLIAPRLRDAAAGWRRHAGWAVALVLATAFIGALVAGLDAGFIYNSFPLMDGRFMPPEAWSLIPWWENIGENPALVQFLHRWLAIATVAVVLWLGWRLLRVLPGLAMAAIAAILIQVGLGIATLLLAVPIALGVAHQAGALTVLTLLLILRHRLGPAATVR